MVAMATSLRTLKSGMSSSDSFTLKTHLQNQTACRKLSYNQSYSPQSQLQQIAYQKFVATATSLSTAGPPSKTWFLRPIRAHNPNGIWIDSAVFTQGTAVCPYILQWVAPFPLKITPSHGGSGLPSNTWLPGPTRVLNPNSISISSAVFAGLTSLRDWQTDRQNTLLNL